MKVWMFAASLLAAVACGNSDPAYCVGEVLAEDQGQGVTDPGFNNPDLVGQTICWGDTVSVGFCKDHDGTWGLTDDYQNGPEPFCEEQGYPFACGGGLYMPTEADCPSSDAR